MRESSSRHLISDGSPHVSGCGSPLLSPLPPLANGLCRPLASTLGVADTGEEFGLPESASTGVAAACASSVTSEEAMTSSARGLRLASLSVGRREERLGRARSGVTCGPSVTVTALAPGGEDTAGWSAVSVGLLVVSAGVGALRHPVQALGHPVGHGGRLDLVTRVQDGHVADLVLLRHRRLAKADAAHAL